MEGKSKERGSGFGMKETFAVFNEKCMFGTSCRKAKGVVRMLLFVRSFAI